MELKLEGYFNKLDIYLGDFAKIWSLGFRLDSRIQAKPASQNPGGSPSRLRWLHSPVLGLSTGGLFGAQLSNLGGRGGCLLMTPFAV